MILPTPTDYGLPESHKKWRKKQLESVVWIQNEYINDAGRIVPIDPNSPDAQAPIKELEAPAGCGKTGKCKAVAYNHSVTAVCRTKALQYENYGGTYSFDVLYGRWNYECVHPKASKGETAGQCRWSERGMHKCPSATNCPYLMQKAKVKASSCRSLNYFYWLAAAWPRFHKSNYLFLDECHEIPDLVVEWAGIAIPNRDRLKWELPPFPDVANKQLLGKKYSDPIQAAVGWLDNVRGLLRRKYRVLADEVDNQEKRRLVRQLEGFGLKIAATIDALLATPGDWFIRSGPTSGYDKNGNPAPAMIIKPLTAKRHFPRYFCHYDNIVMMSATIGNFEAFSRELGLWPEDYATRRVPSQWPPETRPVYALTKCPQMGHKSTPLDYAQQADVIAKCLKGVPSNWSGIIHVTRKREATLLAERLAQRGLQDRIVTMPQLSTDQQMMWWQSHKKHTPNAIVVTWAWSEGVDLGEEKICVVAKVPFSFIADPFERARMEYSHSMFLQRAAWKLEQSLGRTRRGRPEDYDMGKKHRGFVAIADENWRRIADYISESLRESIVEV